MHVAERELLIARVCSKIGVLYGELKMTKAGINAVNHINSCGR
jgi:hypothetical protein